MIPAALTTAARLAPELLSDVVVVAARTPERCLVVADTLLDLGAAAEAVAVARYGQDLAAGTATADGCRAWLEAHADLAA